jgi:glycosyltransferase involved in cell wall biosynthesis
LLKDFHASNQIEQDLLSDRRKLNMRICFVTNRPAWPLYPGFKRRAGMILEALNELGEVDVVMALPDHYDTVPCPPSVDLAHVQVTTVARPSKPQAVLNWVRGPLPMSMNSVQWGGGAATVETLLKGREYDVIWVVAGTAWPVVRDIAKRNNSAALVMDLDDLEDEKIRHRKAATSWFQGPPKAMANRLVDSVDLGRWEKIQQDIVASAAAVTVCSDGDVDKLTKRFGKAMFHAVPNGYTDPGRQQTEADRNTNSPVLLYVGDLAYRPNEEAARFLCESVLPLVRNRFPTVRVRLIGGAGPAGDLALLPGVELAGRVDSIEAELLSASASCAPLLSGGGTRIKIIEAFAYGVPVVATTVGAEGLDAISGRELLIGDSPEDFAKQCCALLADETLRLALRTSGRKSFEVSFTSRSVTSAVDRVLQQVVPSVHRQTRVPRPANTRQSIVSQPTQT